MEETVKVRKYYLKFGDDVPAKEVPRIKWLEEALANGFMRKDKKEPLGWAGENIYGFSLLTNVKPKDVPKDDLDKTLEAFLGRGKL